MQFKKTSYLAIAAVAIASLAGGWFAINSSASSNQNQIPNLNSDDANSMRGMMQHGGHGHTTAPNHGGIPGMMHHNMAMDLGSADEYYDLRFIDAMRLHHRGAIAMAKEAEQKSQRREIKSLARNIIQVQNKEENELLRKWREQWYPQASGPVAYGGKGKPIVPMSEQQQQSMTMDMDLGSADAQFDLRFMNAMIAHHQGAIAMAQDALKKSKRSEIKQLAREIAASQQPEIDQMNQWRKQWYNQ